MTPDASTNLRRVANAEGSAPEHSAHWPCKRTLLGVQVSDTNYDGALAAIHGAACTDRAALVAHMPVHGLVEANRDRSFRAQLNRFDIVAPDGQPIRWALNWLSGADLTDRVYGPELMLRICERAESAGTPIFLLGGEREVVERLSERLTQRFPDLSIAGSESPPFRPLRPDEDRALVDRINASGARIVFIGLGCPKQEKFAFAHRDRIAAVQVCVGAAFDFHSGTKRMAPAWMQKAGLEWLFRLATEPRRLWRRYLVTNTMFVALLARAALTRGVRRLVRAEAKP